MKKLTAYFSASGVTKKVAEKIAALAGTDLYEISPMQPYSKEDLNWMNKNSRSSIEMADKSSRPEILGEIKNMEEYDTIYLGFPIWWYVAPTIINTFLESYDFKGKEVILFATSGSSGFGHTVENLENSCNAACIKEGKVLKANASEKDILDMIK